MRRLPEPTRRYRLSRSLFHNGDGSIIESQKQNKVEKEDELEIEGGAVLEPGDVGPRIARGGALEGGVAADRRGGVARRRQERRRLGSVAALQFGQHGQFGLGRQPVLVAVGHVATVVALS